MKSWLVRVRSRGVLMSLLLEIITKAAVDSQAFASQSKYPIILNADEVLRDLKPENEAANDAAPIKRLGGWRISETDLEIINLGTRFTKKLKRKLKNPSSFNREEFLGLLNSFLEKNQQKIGISVGVDPTDSDYTRVLIEKVGFLIARDVAVLILEACLVLKLWELLEAMIIQGIVPHSSSSLVDRLIERNRSDLLCLCIKYVSDIRQSDLLCILKYLLSPSQDSYTTMMNVRKEWESQALLAIEKATSKSLPEKKSQLAKQASVLLMVAHDEFSSPELCLHYLFASPNLDDLAFSTSIKRLTGSEMLSLIGYLGKWLRKYERFPQAVPCSEGASVLGLKACEWVPSLESVVRCLGLVLDEQFSSLVLHPEFHEELRSLETVVKSLTSVARLSLSVATVIDNLKAETRSG